MARLSDANINIMELGLEPIAHSSSVDIAGLYPNTVAASAALAMSFSHRCPLYLKDQGAVQCLLLPLWLEAQRGVTCGVKWIGIIFLSIYVYSFVWDKSFI